MKKIAAIPIVLLSAAALLTCLDVFPNRKDHSLLVANAEDKADEDTDQERDPALPEIDTSIQIQSGAKIAVVSKSTKGEFWSLVKNGMEQAINDINEAYGLEGDDKISMTFEGSENEEDVENQVNTLDAVIAENPDVLCVSAGDESSCQAQLEAAKENGIPVITFDSDFSSGELVSEFLGTDNQQLGKLAATHLAEAMDSEGMVAVFSGPEKTESCKDRVTGFLSEISAYSGIEVVQVIYSDQVEDMEAAIQGVFSIYPKLGGVFCTNGDISESYLSLAKSAEHEDIPFVGTDATKAQVEAIRGGTEIGAVSQQPYILGYQTIWEAVQQTTQEDTATISKQTRLFDPAWIDVAALDDDNYGNYIY